MALVVGNYFNKKGYLVKLKMIIGLMLFLMSFNVFSDTYPKVPNITYTYTGYSVYGELSGLCIAMKSAWYPPPTYTMSGLTCNFSNGQSRTATTGTNGYTCPGGGTVSGSNCINAPACVSPQVRSAITGMCVAPACAPPKFVNSFGICEIPECPTYQVSNITTGACQIPLDCGSTETYQNSTNTCVLSPLNCPGHSHANASNDGCSPDPKTVCSAGQHDDGTYNCIADTPPACSPPKTYGYIDGISQCINPTGQTPDESAAIQAVNDAAQQAAEAQAANTACTDATAWWNDEPTNEARRIDMSNKCAIATSKASNAANSASKSESSNTKETNSKLAAIDKTIADKTTRDEQREEGKQAGAGGDNCNEPPPCTGDAIQCAILVQTHKNNCRSQDDPKLSDTEAAGNSKKIDDMFKAGTGTDFGVSAFNGQTYASTSFWNLSGSNCETVPMNYKSLHYTFDPCGKLAVFRSLLGWFFYIYTAFSIVQLVRES